ncbi:T9SS type A sorting domain-containing protein [Sediminibacterium sp.]|uniref:T9SS type A sorting domain-containing protein n=1 Tax=Sediminibacterium sp. TaxID=1917865 RepID=UPI003F731099
MRPYIFTLLLFLAATGAVFGQASNAVIYSNKKNLYQQNFNDLPSGGSTTLTGKGPFAFSQAPFALSGLVGWEFLQKSGTSTNAVFAIGAGTSTSAGVYSVGATGSIDRGLGMLAAGTGVYAVGLVITNQTGDSLNTITGSFTTKQWRKGGSGNSNTWTGKYAVGAINNIDHPNPINHGPLNFTSIQFSSGVGSLNGNLVENQQVIQFTITGIQWKNGEQLMLRWDDLDESGSDDLVAIDNFSFSADKVSTTNNAVTVDSLHSLASSITNTDTIRYAFKPGGDITGLSTSNFALITDGLTNATITGVSGTGSDYLINVYTGSGAGKMVLGINNDNNLIPGLRGLPFFSIDTQQIDKIKPLQISFSSLNDTIIKLGDTLKLQLTFNETVHLDSASPLRSIPILIGNKKINVQYVSGNNSNQLLFQHIIEAGEKDRDGITLADGFNNDQLIVKDIATNASLLSLTSSPIQHVQVDASTIKYLLPKDSTITQCNTRDSIDIVPLLVIDSTDAGDKIKWEVTQLPKHWSTSQQSLEIQSGGGTVQPIQWKMSSNGSEKLDSISIRIFNEFSSAEKTIFLQSNSWIGNTDSNWHNPLNWCNTLIPNDSATITISQSALYQPVLTGTHGVKNLYLSKGASLRISGTLKMSGVMQADSASIAANNATIELNGNNPQTINGQLFKENKIEHLIIKNNTNTQVSNQLIVRGNMQLAAGSLSTNSNLFLTETAAITSSAAGTSINGIVHAANIFSKKAAGTYLAGQPFDQSLTFNNWANKPTIFYNHAASNTDSFSIESSWKPFDFAGDTTTNSWKKYQGIQWRVLSNQNSENNPTYLSGTIQMGTQQILLSQLGNGFNVIANPYLSPVNTGTFTKAKMVSNYKYIWNPLMGNKGGYMVLPFAQQYILNPFEAYIVQTDSSIENEITVSEASKSIEWNKGIIDDYKETVGYFATINLLNNQILQDRFILREHAGAKNGKDSLDADKLLNPGVNLFSKSSDGAKLAVDSRILQAQTIVPIELSNVEPGNYTFQIHEAFMPSEFKLVLYDTYTNNSMPLIKDSIYQFSITTDSLSKASSRFYIGKYIPKSTSPLSNLLTVKLYPNPATSEIKVSIKANSIANSTVRLFNMAGTLIKTIELGNIQQGLISIPITSISNGQYFIQVTSGSLQQNIPFIKQ